MTPQTLCALSFLAVLGFTTAAQAEIPRAVRLEYTLERGAERCPSEQVFRDTVNARMRFDPFAEDAPARLTVAIRFQGGMYYGRAELPDGTAEGWSWEINPPLRDCRTAIHALGVAIASKLDPPGPAPKPPPEKPPAVPPPAPVRAPPKSVPASRPFRLRCGLQGALALWTAPSDVAAEVAADCGLRWPMFSLSAELRGSPPAGAEVPLTAPPGTTSRVPLPANAAVDVSTSRLTGAIIPCAHWPFKVRLNPTPFACAVVQAGAVFGSASGLEGAPPLPYWAGGGRLGLEVDATSWLTARAGTDLLAVLARPSFTFEGLTVWTAPVFSMAVGGGLVASF